MTDTLTAERPGDDAPDAGADEDDDRAGAAEEQADDGGPRGSRWARLRSMPAEGWITLGVVAVCVGFTLSHLQPSLLIADTTPAGGDMGAHVWGPAYLRDHLLVHGRLTGWTPDWYAGFPAYHFYMVIPSLMILVLDLVLPYGIAFKLVTVSGILTLPIAAWAFGRLSGLRFPGPPLLAVATLPFLFDQGFTIYGGNIASTLAGEFAFSISLSFALVYLGVVARGLETGRHRALAAALLGLCVLCHLIPAIFALVGTVVWLLLRPGRGPLTWVATMAPIGALVASFWVVPFYLRRAYLNDMGWEKLTDYWINLVPADNRWLWVFPIVGAVFAVVRRSRTGIWLVLMVGAFAVGFVVAPQGRLWNARLLPFYFLCLYLLGGYAIAEAGKTVGRIVGRATAPPPAVASAASGPAVGRDGAIDAGDGDEVPDPAPSPAPGGGSGTETPRPAPSGLSPERTVRLFTPLVGLVFVLVLVALPLHALPFGSTGADGVYRWLGLHTSERSFVDGWARWNYSGYERKEANATGGGYTEYHALMQTMAQVGEEQGCGRAMWEYEKELDRYGTPMALMLLPHWTDGCIGSMEGLYFEASSTTPYHFLNQSELSTAPSRAQRDLPYRNFDIDAGIEHLQLLGVRYYLAFSPQAVEAADAHEDLTPVATSGPWHVYEIADSELVSPLTNEPAVLEGVSDAIHSWLPPSVEWYQDPSQWDVPLAASGPEDWPRVEVGETPERVPVDPVTVTNIESGDDSLSFDVDEVGSPVLVKVSYFPNWQVSGADGPYRVTPNLMVVVPKERHVELHYGYTNVDYLAWALTLLGLAGLVWLARTPPVDMSPRRVAAGSASEDAPGATSGPEGADHSTADRTSADTGDPGVEAVPASSPSAPSPDPGGPVVDPGAADLRP
ncbi:MAG: hypothetical protein JNK12_18515 [Acidimicrobiales bacterium]|nr:hypothetical protein [Acidimicrobiales bacterium]